MQCNVNGKDMTCGERYPLNDAAGTFCTFVCAKCEKAKRRTFNPAIFDRGSRYAVTGEESDIDSEF